jgi:hypothetical protein
MGTLSFGQLMREAYPGAIYYYATIPYRVTRVNVKSKTVTVRREKRYTTQPQKTLPAVFPRLAPGGVLAAGRQDGLIALETSLLVRESIRGVLEQRGRTESLYSYPLSREMGFFQDQPFFSRNYFTTGVFITHPALEREGASPESAAALVYEAFLLMIPFERQDIGFAADRLRVTREPFFHAGQPFLAIYDQTYGSLRLSTRLLEPGALGRVLFEALMLGGRQGAKPADLPVLDPSPGTPSPGTPSPGMAAPGMAAPGMAAPGMAAPDAPGTEAGAPNELRAEGAALPAEPTAPAPAGPSATLLALAEMVRAAFREPREPLAFGLGGDPAASLEAAEARDPARWERVVMPGSKGLMVRTNEEFMILRILNTPMGLSYEGTPASMEGSGASLMPLLGDVAEIPGESAMGWYDVSSGAVEPSAVETAQVRVTGESAPPPAVDPAWLARMLSVYFPESALIVLAARLGAPVSGEKAQIIQGLVTGVDLARLLDTAVEVYLGG